MANERLQAPELDELEVSVFGPGYGEAIAVHAGAGTWFLVDSCSEPESRLPASLKYLTDLSVDVAQAVKLVVATHWHDDHVRGLATIVEKCTSASLAVSSALITNEFLRLLSVYYDQTLIQGSSGTKEIATVFRHLEGRKQEGMKYNPPQFATMDRLLYRGQLQLPARTAEAKVFSLSPSDASILASKLAFADLLPQAGDQKKRVAALTPNYTSVVLWIQLDGHSVLLGADLETSNDPTTGWSVILSDSKVIEDQATIFKIPHHGSVTAHHDDIWSDLLAENPHSVLTPFRKGKVALPSSADIQRITNLTSHVYSTAPPRFKKERWSRRIVRDFVDQTTKSINPVALGWGQVRLRRKIDGDGEWRIALFGDAYSPKFNGVSAGLESGQATSRDAHDTAVN